ncbi:putative baseplate assembly protein [Granulicella sp. WH15]|uniref:putative baseplate assembly protein n=1 Tax=Granulicella sp. WH15 TaxID=2602070 RepID=UPI00136793C6|nr:putative baseplate assembly protein [Granulicella sp. WH15]QHN04116.1 putative baseplate assembly protein [Granulicella sp. WH15]
MAANVYTCGNALRRGKVLEAGTLNGIDFLEVMDSAAVTFGLPRQTTLLLYFLHPVTGLSAANFVLSGGVRTTDTSILWAFRADAMPTDVVTAAQAAAFAALDGADRILVLRSNGTGDFSTYTLSLVRSAGQTAAPDGFDPRLASVDFSFKVECPSDFDCATDTECAPATPTDLPIDYLAKDYASFRQLMLDRMATTIPNWTERSPADLGVALVETLAYAADRLSYFQDAVATEAYLGTARRRVSVRRHAVLLGYAMHDGCNARVWVFVEVMPSMGIAYIYGPGHAALPVTLFVTQSSLPLGQVSRTDALTAVSTGAALPFQALHDLKAYSANNQILIYTWSDTGCCLPVGSTSATLRDDGSEAVVLAAGDALLLEEIISPVTGAAADVDASHRCVVRLTTVTPSMDPLTGTRLLEVTWAAADALTFSLCLSASVEALGDAMLTDLSVARGNMVLADHGVTVEDEALQPAVVPSTGVYRPVLANTGLTFQVPYDDAAARSSAVSTLQTMDPRVALPAITLQGSESVWQPVDNLLNATPFEQSFVVETEDDGSATLRFGDGTLGELPESDMTATYRIGNGSEGNVGAGSISNVTATAVASVRNPLAAAGGVDPEPTDQVRLYAPQAFRVQQRAVTPQDYADIAGQRADVQKAMATRRWTGSWYTMFVTVERASAVAVDATFEKDVAAYLEPFRLMGYDIEVLPPVFVPLDIAFSVCVKSGYLSSSVEAALYQSFSSKRMANGQTGFFYPANFTFGQTVYLSTLIARAMQVPGVQWINTDPADPRNRFQRWGQAAAGELQAGEIRFSDLEIAQLSNDPSSPEDGRIVFTMMGGL